MEPMQTHSTFEVSTPTDREIVMTRVFNAPRATVFDAFTKPELIARWLLGPDGWSMPVCEVDLRPGGRYHYLWRNDAGDKEFGVSGVYREIVKPELVVHAERFDDPWYPGEALVTNVFVERDGRTNFTMTIAFESKEARDLAIETGMAHGVEASYDRLAGILAAPASA